MIDQSRIIFEQERYNDMLREAEQRRAVRLALSQQSKRNGVCCYLLVALGRTLTALGVRLQARYGAMIELPAGYILSTESNR